MRRAYAASLSAALLCAGCSTVKDGPEETAGTTTSDAYCDSDNDTDAPAPITVAWVRSVDAPPDEPSWVLPRGHCDSDGITALAVASDGAIYIAGYERMTQYNPRTPQHWLRRLEPDYTQLGSAPSTTQSSSSGRCGRR